MATAEFPRHVAAAEPDQTAAPAAAELEKHLLRLAARRNRVVALQTLVRALLPAAILSAIGTLLYRFFLLDGAPWMLGVLFAASVIVAIVIARMRRCGPFVAARDADRKWKLHDLLSSALALAVPQSVETLGAKWWQSNVRGVRTKTAPNTTPMVTPLIQQAAQRAATINGKELYPMRFDRALQVLAVAFVVLGAALVMPDNPRFLSAQRRADNAELKLQGKKLEEAAKKAQEKKGLTNNAKASIAARKLEAMAKRMQTGRMTRKEALLGMGELKKELSKASSEQQSTKASDIDIQRMREALSKGNFASEQAQQMQKELQQNRDAAAAQQMEKIAEKLQNPSGMSQSEKEKTARDLEEAARALRQQNSQAAKDAAKQLEQAAKDLRNQQSQNGQSQNGQNQNGQQSQNQQSQSGQSQSGQQQSGQNSSSSGASDALNKMAQGLRNSGNSSSNDQAVRDMMKKIQEAEGNGQPGQGQSGQGQQGEGQNGQGQQGEGQQGQGQGEGQGQGQGNDGTGNGSSGSGEGQGDGRSGVTPGKDLKATDPNQSGPGGAGLGPRNNVKGGVGKGGEVSKLRSNKSDDDRRWQDVWSDRLPDTQKKSTRIKGKMGSAGESERLQTKTEAKGGAAKTPYYDVYESYRRDAEDAISREDVPPAYQAPVKEYFDSIKPN